MKVGQSEQRKGESRAKCGVAFLLLIVALLVSLRIEDTLATRNSPASRLSYLNT